MSALSRIRRAVTLVAASVVVAKGRIEDLRERVAKKTVVPCPCGDDSRLIGVELQVPIQRWRAALVLGFDPFTPALDCRLRILATNGAPASIRILFPATQRVRYA